MLTLLGTRWSIYLFATYHIGKITTIIHRSFCLAQWLTGRECCIALSQSIVLNFYCAIKNEYIIIKILWSLTSHLARQVIKYNINLNYYLHNVLHLLTMTSLSNRFSYFWMLVMFAWIINNLLKVPVQIIWSGYL